MSSIIIERKNVTRHTLVNQGQDADIFIEHGEDTIRGQRECWLNITIRSSLGNWGAHWDLLGDRDWREFIATSCLDPVFAKFAGDKRFTADLNATARKAVIRANELEAIGEITESEHADILEDIDAWRGSDINLFILTMARSPAFRESYSDLVVLTMDPNIVCFWESLWLPWRNEMAEELRIEVAEAAAQVSDFEMSH